MKQNLENFCLNNNITSEKIFEMLESKYPKRFTHDKEIPNLFIEEIYNHYGYFNDGLLDFLIDKFVRHEELIKYDIKEQKFNEQMLNLYFLD